MKIRPLAQNRLEVKFEGELPEGYLDPDNYVFSNGLVSLAVMVSGKDTVELTTTQQEVDKKYELAFRGNNGRQEIQPNGG